MSITRVNSGLRFNGTMTPFNAIPKVGIFALKTPYFDGYATLWQMRGAANDGFHGYHELAIGYGMYVLINDRGYNYGAPIGTPVKVEPGYNLQSDGRTNQWTWFMVHIDSLSSRGFRVQNSVDFTAAGTFNAGPQLDRLELGWGMPATAKMAQVHYYSALNASQFAAIVAGTLDPATIPTLIDGFVFRDNLNSVKGLLTAVNYSTTAPVLFDATDNPTEPASGGGGEVTPETGRKARSGGFGW